MEMKKRKKAIAIEPARVHNRYKMTEERNGQRKWRKLGENLVKR